MKWGNGTVAFGFIIAISLIFSLQYQEAQAGGGLPLIIINSVDGGDCGLIGMWDQNTLTCDVDGFVSNPIQIVSNDITLTGGPIEGLCNAPAVLAENVQNITIKNFHIDFADVGIKFVNVDDSTISNVAVHLSCSHGLDFSAGSDNNTIENSEFNDSFDDNIIIRDSSGNDFTDVEARRSHSDDGFDLENADNNTFTNVQANNNDDEGLDLEDDSDGNTFSDSEFNSNESSGIELSNSDKNIFENNNIKNNQVHGIDLTSSSDNDFFGNTVENNGLDGGEGITLDDSHTNEFRLNIVLNNDEEGFDIEDGSSDNIVACNYLSENRRGVEFEASGSGNIVTGNTFDNNNDVGLLFDESSGNEAFRNNFIDQEDSVRNVSVDEDDNDVFNNYFENSEVYGTEILKKVQCDDDGKVMQSACVMYAGMERFGNENPRDGSVATVNLNTGILTELGPGTIPIKDLIQEEDDFEDVRVGLSGIAFNSEGRLFGSMVVEHAEFGIRTGLVEIDPITGNVLFETLEDIPNISSEEVLLHIVDLAFYDDVLYGIGNAPEASDEFYLFTIPLEPEEGDEFVEATVLGRIALIDDFTEDVELGGLAFLSDGTMIITGYDDDEGEFVISFYTDLEDEIIEPDDWFELDQFYDGLGVSCEGEIYATTVNDDSIYLISLEEGEGIFVNEQFAAGAGTNPGDVDFVLKSLVEPPEVEDDKSNGADNQWDARPTFGINHEDRSTQIVENGFRFNEQSFTITDNHHTDFARQSINVGETNSFAATVYAPKTLWIQEFLFGVPAVGEGHLAEVGVEVWYDNDGNIDEVKVVQQTNVIDPETIRVTHQKSLCLRSDSEPRCDTTTVSMTFREPLMYDVTIIKATDQKRRSQSTSLNEGFDILGKSLNPMPATMIPSPIKGEGLILVTQHEKYSDYWISENGRIFEKNSFGSFTQIDKKFERFQDKGDPRTRLHSGFGGLVIQEQQKATGIFDSSSLISELPPSFAYQFPETAERIDEKMRQEMIIQEHIAQKLLENVSKQARFY